MLFVALSNLRSTFGRNLMYLKLPNSAKLLSAKPPLQPIQKNVDGEKPQRPKTEPVPKITLILSDDNINVTTLVEAQHLSKRRDLKLVKIVDLDSKSQRPVYKLMRASEYHNEEMKYKQQRKIEKSGTIKGEKMLMINAQISKHDLEVHIKKITKWIAKKYEVRVVISGDAANVEKSEKIYKFFEDSLKDVSRILQKRVKGSDLKFQIIPPKQLENSERSL